MSSIAQDIILNLPEFAALVQHRALGPYRIGDRQVEIRLDPRIDPKLMSAIAAVLEINPDASRIDPPEAREFLRRGNARKGRR